MVSAQGLCVRDLPELPCLGRVGREGAGGGGWVGGGGGAGGLKWPIRFRVWGFRVQGLGFRGYEGCCIGFRGCSGFSA